MVWGKPLADTPTGKLTSLARPAPVSPLLALAALAPVGALTWALVAVAGLGPSLAVVLVAAFGSAGAVLFARGTLRFAVVTLLVISMTGVGWIELVNKAQYGTLALTGAPPLVRWCGNTYQPSGVITAAASTGAGPTYSQILRTPAGYDVFGVALHGQRSCGMTGPLFVELGKARYAEYDTRTPAPAALVARTPTPATTFAPTLTPAATFD